MGVFTNIEAALNTRLATLSASPAVDWPNTSYEPTIGTTFIRPTLLPAATILSSLAGTEEHKGIYQIEVFVPTKKGVSALNTLLDSIQDLFKASRVLTATDVVWVQAVSRSPAQRQEAWYTGSVEVNYLCLS